MEFKTGLAMGLSAVAVGEAQPAMGQHNPYAAPEAVTRTIDAPQAAVLGGGAIHISELGNFSSANLSIPAQTPPVEATPIPAPAPEATTSQQPPVATMTRVDAKACADDSAKGRYSGTLRVQDRKVSVTVKVPKLKKGCEPVMREEIMATGHFRMKIGGYSRPLEPAMTKYAETKTTVAGSESKTIVFKRMRIPKNIYDVMCSKKATTSTGLKKGKLQGFSVNVPHKVSAVDRNGGKIIFDINRAGFKVSKKKVKACTN